MDKKLTNALETLCVILLTDKLSLNKELMYYWCF